MQTTIANACSSSSFTHLYPHSLISIAIRILSQDGSILAACINAATLALVDAGIPMSDYTIACTAGLALSSPTIRGGAGGGEGQDRTDPLLDLNGVEEQELPFLTVATLGAGEKVSVLVMESRVQVSRLESMLAVGVDGCKQVREILDKVVRAHGKKLLASVIS